MRKAVENGLYSAVFQLRRALHELDQAKAPFERCMYLYRTFHVHTSFNDFELFSDESGRATMSLLWPNSLHAPQARQPCNACVAATQEEINF